MRMVYEENVLSELDFAREAGMFFAKNKEITTYTSQNIDDSKGEFFAVRWGMGKDCVLVLKLDEYFEPTNYQNIVGQFEESL